MHAFSPKKRLSSKIVFLVALLLILIGLITLFGTKTEKTIKTQPVSQTSSRPTLKDRAFNRYTLPKIQKKDVYILFMVGDSMTETLGPYGGKVTEFMNNLYHSTPGHQRIVIDNYAKGSTNLLGLHDTMKQKIITEDRVLEPLLSRSFDVILVESFGYNPPSELGLEEGLKKQTQTLEQLMELLQTTHPDSIIIFVATIAPHKTTYAKNVDPDTPTAERVAQAEERMAYIKNHIAFAKEHSIPLIDIYTESLTPNGDGNLNYINPTDNIHPSFTGVDFISHEIANYIYETNILPR